MRFARLSTAALLLSLSVPAWGQSSYAVYDLTFDATWSQITHPNAYPAGAHFSPLIGGTHDDTIHFWEVGGLASPGMELMAETGGTATLKNEVQAEINAGHAGAVVTGPGTPSPGQVSTTLTVTDEFPLATVVTMIAPSPDWFVGVDGVALRVNGQWLDQVVVDLYAYDAGTDNGTNFNSANDDNDPQDPIELMVNGPFFGVVPLGTFTFTRLEECSPVTYCNPADGSLDNVAQLSISDCDLSTTITLHLTNGPAFQATYLLIGDGNTVVNQPPGAVGDLCITGGSCLGRYAKDVGTISMGGEYVTDISDSMSGGPNYGIPNCGGTLQSGETWYFQYWHRQAGQPSSFSEALAVTFL